ncbi:MAG: ABC transporter ATP-binding protein [Anaerolineales bacterium]|nr:ABC transporter ATP-binding protein [Anaerolineales bacterium]
MTPLEKKGKNQLVITSVSKNFAGLHALSDVSLTLEEGEILGLIGPNGSGKTTLINVITGLLPASAGKIEINGRNITNSPPHLIARSGLARTFQTIRLFKELSVMENVEVAAVSIGLPRAQARQRAETLLNEMGLDDWKTMSAGGLPYGHERRLEIARALAMAPKFLLLDEPAAGLNEEESDELLTILASIPQSKNLGMLVVEHDMRLIMRLCHRLHVLNYGRTIGQGAPEQVRKIPEVLEAYLGASASGG